jgi:hypothetical protein
VLKTPKNFLHLTLALSLAALWPATSYADRSIGVSSDPDTRTTFKWVGEEKNKDPDAYMMVMVQNGGSTYGTNVTESGVDVTFAKSDMSQLKWCAYLEKKGAKKCKPDKAMKPGGEIRIP